MTVEDMSAPAALGIETMTERDLVAHYAFHPVRIGALTMPLFEALEKEVRARAGGFCPASDADDPEKRLGFLAKILDAAGSLKDEHRMLLPPPEIMS